MNIAVAIIGLALLILVHEAGHFFVARAVGMRPRKFYIGFPPALAKIRRRGIEYGLGAIPLGGYVKIPGMHRPAPVDLDLHFGKALSEAPSLTASVERVKRVLAAGDMAAAANAVEDLRAAVADARLSPGAARSAERGLGDLGDGLGTDAYWRQATWKKIAVIFAGPGTNLVFAIGLLAVVFLIGVPVETTRTVDTVLADSPAQAAGLRPGDQIVAIQGRPIAADRISETIRASRGRPLLLTVARAGERRTVGPVTPRLTDGRYRLGFALEPRFESYGFFTSIRLASETTWEVTKAIGQALSDIATGESRDDVASPVGIVMGSTDALEAGFRYYLQVLALISLSLALLNLLPLLPLDGGHITFSLIEGLRGRSLGREVYERVSFIGIALVLFLFAIGLSNDIGRISG
jgi:regulator of sigma E protease